jgi:RNA polymerase sigma factor (sigma-70 family)
LAVVALILSVALAWFADGLVVRLLLDQAGDRAADEVQLGLVDRVTPHDFATPVEPAQFDNLAARLDPVVTRLRGRGSGILRINVIAPDGTILYSDLRSIRGRTIQLGDKPELATALQGGTGADETALDGDENADLHAGYARALEVYVPVRIGGTVAGAYEIYEEDGRLRIARSLVWTALFLSWCVAGLALFLRRRWRQDRRAKTQIDLPDGPNVAFETSAMANADRDWRVRLTPRELEVLQLMATSHSNRDIAEQLGVSQETVRTHVKRILHKLDQPDRTQAVLAALREGILDLPRAGFSG